MVLYQSLIRKAIIPLRRYDQVIKHRQVKYYPSFFELPGQLYIRFTGIEIPRWMIMGKDDGANDIQWHFKSNLACSPVRDIA